MNQDEERKLNEERSITIKLKPLVMRVFWRELLRSKTVESALSAARATAKACMTAALDPVDDLDNQAESWILDEIFRLGEENEPTAVRPPAKGE